MEITRNGKRVAILEPAQPHPLAPLIDSGGFRPATGPLTLLPVSEVEADECAGLDAVVQDRYGEKRC